mmetsp:Transcript_40910/g.116025  ORF Transcript_40910/g.116025 Transcript_40910/m.116025 type:complete len:252 (+) Transcript_40910:2-757(+)
MGQERAAGVLQNLLSHAEKRWDVLKAGALPPLIDILEEGSPLAKARAAGALRNLAFDDDDGVVAIVEAGGIEPLVAVLGAASAEAQENAAAALLNLALLDYCKLAIARAGGIELLVALEAAGAPATRKVATKTLQSLALEEFNAPRIAHARDVQHAALRLQSDATAPFCQEASTSSHTEDEVNLDETMLPVKDSGELFTIAAQDGALEADETRLGETTYLMETLRSPSKIAIGKVDFDATSLAIVEPTPSA